MVMVLLVLVVVEVLVLLWYDHVLARHLKQIIHPPTDLIAPPFPFRCRATLSSSLPVSLVAVYLVMYII